MKKLLLLITVLFSGMTAFAQCGTNLVYTSTTVFSSNDTINTMTASNSAMQDIVVCAGNTLTYNYSPNYKSFYVEGGATLVLNEIQVCNVHLASGATLVIDTLPGNQQLVGIQQIFFDSSNVTVIDTNQIMGGLGWQPCTGAIFNYVGFPSPPCTPLAVVDNSVETLLNLNFENPVRDQITLNALLVQKLSRIQIVDVSGKTINSIHNLLQPIDVSYLPQGIYFLQMKSKEGNTVAKKFFKN